MTLPVTTSGGEVPLTVAVVTGIAKERVHPSTLQLLDDLFPGHHGVEFAARLLRLAEAKQLALPELGYTETADVAVIAIQSIRVLAKLIGWSYDTTEKYLVVLCCLRLLYKQRSRHQIMLYFPLRRCQLPEPEVLDTLQDLRPGKQTPRYRAKVRVFAAKVQRQFVLVRKKGDFDTPTLSPDQFDSDHLPHLLLEDVRGILQQEVDSETASRLFLKIEGAVRYRCSHPQSRLSERKGDFEGERGSFQEQKSSFGSQEGDFGQEPSAQQGLRFSQKGDFPSGKVIVEGTLQREKSPFVGRGGDSLPEPSAQQSHLLARQGDSLESLLILQEQKSPFGSQEGDFVRETSIGQHRLLPKKGDFCGVLASSDEQGVSFSKPKGDFVEWEEANRGQKSTFSSSKGDSLPTPSIGSLNDNGNIYIASNNKRDDNVNDPLACESNQADRYSKGEIARVGYQLAMFLEQKPRNKASFIKCCKEDTRTVIRAAVVDMLVHSSFPTVDPADERGRPRIRAAWFHDARRRYAQPGTPLPAFVKKWVDTDLSWQEIERDLVAAAAKYGRYMVGETCDVVRSWLRAEISEEELEAALVLTEQQRTGSVESGIIRHGSVELSPKKLWLDEAEARLLAKVMLSEIASERELLGEATTTAKAHHGVWEVELIWEGGTVVPIASLGEWQEYFEGVKQSEITKRDWIASERARQEKRGAHGTPSPARRYSNR